MLAVDSQQTPSPLLTVVIPTHRRPKLLIAAIESALRASHNDSVEVIVVPNGFDESWREVQRQYSHKPEVRWLPIPRAHANSARNHGMQAARGSFIRFLDDDDALRPEGAQRQLMLAEEMGLDIVSGAVTVVDESMHALNQLSHAARSDLFSSMANPARICLPVSHLFRLASISQFQWAEDLPFEQDTEWMLRLAAARQWKWVAIDDVVGYWRWHDAERTSGRGNREDHARITTDLLLHHAKALKPSGRLSRENQSAVLDAVFENARANFPESPRWWGRAMKTAQDFAPGLRARNRFYDLPVIRHFDPVLTEWALLPMRWVSRRIRATRRIRHFR